LLLCGKVCVQDGADDIGEPPFENAKGFQPAVCAAFAPGHQVIRGGMPVGLGHRDAVQGSGHHGTSPAKLLELAYRGYKQPRTTQAL
jgi:hypothetical protein